MLAQTAIAAAENGTASRRNENRLRNQRSKSNCRSREGPNGLRKTQTFERERFMTADEIRETNYGEVAYLREIAAQLAVHNEHLDRLEWLAENVISLNCGGLQVKVNHD
jgi:hypothetical protein